MKILSSYADTAVKQIQLNIQSTGTNATGKTSRSIHYTISDNGEKITLQILGRPYITSIETGRKATPDYTKPSVQFVASIKEWVKAKGLPEGSAYAIAKSIHAKGTKLFREGGRKDIISSVLNQSFIDQIAKDILDTYAKILVVNVKEIYGKPA